MSRIDQQGIKHPTASDEFDIAKDAPHFLTCTECREDFPAAASIVDDVNQADVSNQTNTLATHPQQQPTPPPHPASSDKSRTAKPHRHT